ncbi:MAG: TIGR04283 family arsenosugar biosynthesis glycosyltransferase [Elainella sp. C42_A2020_010]|nr:TIGR04283 family arsenosugar biosynthesis glycosyltransferase [Elainella sp. C42_A2020_010]
MRSTKVLLTSTLTSTLTKPDCLIIFTRYPQPGKAKTRLIPALGATGAADLQRQMTEHTLGQVRQLQASYPVTVEIWFAGTAPKTEVEDRLLMQSWLGSEWNYQAQQGEDLGARLIYAIQAAFAAGMERVVAIGTDCPQLDADKLEQAFRALYQRDLVLGPATDGGYYLIGLSQFVPQLFKTIAWSSELVLQQTVQIAESLNLTVAYLDMLSDVDRPEDLAIWQAVQQASQSQPEAASEPILPDRRPFLSVIIPVLNEANRIQTALRSLQEEDVEVIVVDGGSQDDSVARAKAMGVKVVSSAQGRAVQMNVGAKAARGEVLLFLHADTSLPAGFVSLVRQTLAQPEIIAGAFELQIAGPEPGLRWIEGAVKWRSRLLQLPYGDQALFLMVETFRQLGGFIELPIMEDFELVRRLQRYGKIAIAPAAVITSGRRWQTLGVWRTTLINQLIIAAYFLGVSPARLAHWYRGVGKASPNIEKIGVEPVNSDLEI